MKLFFSSFFQKFFSGNEDAEYGFNHRAKVFHQISEIFLLASKSNFKNIFLRLKKKHIASKFFSRNVACRLDNRAETFRSLFLTFYLRVRSSFSFNMCCPKSCFLKTFIRMFKFVNYWNSVFSISTWLEFLISNSVMSFFSCLMGIFSKRPGKSIFCQN